MSQTPHVYLRSVNFSKGLSSPEGTGEEEDLAETEWFPQDTTSILRKLCLWVLDRVHRLVILVRQKGQKVVIRVLFAVQDMCPDVVYVICWCNKNQKCNIFIDDQWLVRYTFVRKEVKVSLTRKREGNQGEISLWPKVNIFSVFSCHHR